MRKMFLKGLAKGSSIFSCTFVKEINCYGLFHIQKLCQNKRPLLIAVPVTFSARHSMSDGSSRGVNRGAHGVMVIVVGNGHGDRSSNLERD